MISNSLVVSLLIIHQWVFHGCMDIRNLILFQIQSALHNLLNTQIYEYE